MAVDPLVEVGYEGQQYMVPKSVLQAGMAKQFIEDQLAEQADRQSKRQAKVKESVEGEFAVIKTKLAKVDGIEESMAQMQQTVDAYASANAALKAQVAALEESGGVLGGANSTARQTAYDLSNASTSGANLLGQLQTAQTVLNEKLDRMFERVEQLEVQQTQVLTNANAAAKTSQSLLQEAVARALDEAAKAEARAAAAEAVAAQALSDARSSQRINDGTLTRQQLNAEVGIQVTDEWKAQQDAIVNAVVDQLRDEFPNGLGAQRIDKNRTRQLRSDANNFNDAARGGIG